MNSAVKHAVSFGPFRLHPTQHLLLQDEKPIRLGSRSFDILAMLVEHSGQLVSKEELITRVWPGIFVEEGNLRVHVAALRKTLGDGKAGNRYIANVPGRGYRFVAPVSLLKELTAPPAIAAKPMHNLPTLGERMVGRADIVDSIMTQLPGRRCITIVGTGGIGKTRVAVAAAEMLMAAYRDSVHFIDLAPLADPRLVPSTLASALRVTISSEDPVPGLIAYLKDKSMLLVLDSCEHVIEAAAALAEQVFIGAPGIHILATSREPLRVEGEHVQHLSPLAVPPASEALKAVDAINFPAIQLFVERAAAGLEGFELTDTNASIVADICRKLDGNALAIELAAARVDAFALAELASRLDDRLRLLNRGRRTALPRHQTLRAMLDWSYEFLPQAEQVILRRLAIFAGEFTMETAVAITISADMTASDVANHVADLVAKSLIVADVCGETASYRLLGTTHAYALTKLTESGEAEALGRRHAAHYRDLIEAARKSTDDDYSAFTQEIDNIRAALTWAFAPTGDHSIAVALAAASAPIWLEMSLLTECHGWMGKALDLLDDIDRGTRREMMLQTDFGISLMFSQGMGSRARAALMRANELAESLQDHDYQLQALNCLARYCNLNEDFGGGLAYGRQAERIAKTTSDPVGRAMADCVLAASLFYLGEYVEALMHARRIYRQITPAARSTYIVRSGVDYSIWAGSIVANVLWVQGLFDQSAQTARDVVADARASGNAVSLCHALTWAGCNISLRLGDIETADRLIAELKYCAEKHGLSSYFACGVGFEGRLQADRGDIAAGERLHHACLNGLRKAEYEQHYTRFLSSLAEVLARADHLDDSAPAIDEVLQRIERNDVFWLMPEALRIKGVIVLLKKETKAAEEFFGRSLDLARRQQALFWELRTAVSLGQLRYAQGRTREAYDLLSSVYGRFTEGFHTIELQHAKSLIHAWADA